MAPVILLIPPLLVVCKALLTVVGTSAASAALEGVVDAVTKQKHEKQLQECLERAFKQTKKQFKWLIKDKTAYSNFKSSLVSFAGTFEQDSLKKLLGTSIGKEISDLEVKTWIDNLIKQITLNEHNELFKYLMLNNIIVDKSAPQQQVTLDYLLTYTTPVWDNIDVICRDEIIKDLYDKFSTGVRRIQVAGMGGLGKSEILVKFFSQLSQPNPPVHFDYIGFIRFNDNLESNFRSQIPYLADYARKNGEEAARLFLQQLCATNRVLFCIDDDRDKKDILKKNDPYFAFLKTLNASILFASRTEYAEFEQQPFPPLSTEACIEVFQRMYGQEIHNQKDIDILTNIIKELSGNNTLIINRLGNMAKENNFTIDKLHKNLQDKNFHIKTGCEDEEELQQQISKLYPLCELTRPGERNLVEAFSIFPVNPLPIDLCTDWLHEDAGIDEEECSLALTRLSKQTWLEKRINISDGEVLFSMHQCVKSAVKDQTPVEYSAHQSLVESCRASLNKFTNAYLLQKSSFIIPFAVSIFEGVYIESELIAALSSAVASYYFKSADYSHALEWYQKDLTISEEVLGKEHPNTATTHNNIASVYHSQGQYDLALERYRKALAINEKVLGKDHPDTATTYNNIAGVYDSQGQSDLALEWYQKALVIHEKVLGKEHPDTAATYNNMAGTYLDQGKFDLALEWYQKALAINEKRLGRDHPDTATTYNNIAGTYVGKGECEFALEWYHKALVIYEKVLGKDHPDTAIAYNNIAGVYYSQHEYDLALEWYQKALITNENALGRDHPNTATNYNNIANVYKNQGEYGLALEWYRKALTIIEKMLGKYHPITASTFNNIAGIYLSQGQNDLALELYHRALDTRERVLGKDHPDTAASYNNIANVYCHQEKFSLALMWLQKALFVFERNLSNEHLDTAQIVKNIAVVYYDLGKYAQALEYFKRALLVFEAKLSPEDPCTIDTRMAISNLENYIRQ